MIFRARLLFSRALFYHSTNGKIYPAFRLGPVYRGQFGEVLSFLWPTVHTTFSNAPTFRGQSRLSDFGCALDHSATRFRACAHLMKTAVRYQLRAQGRSPLPGPNMFGGTTGRSPGERPHYGIAGGKSRQTGPNVNAGLGRVPKMSKAKQWFLRGPLRPIKFTPEAMALVAFNWLSYRHCLTLWRLHLKNCWTLMSVLYDDVQMDQ